MLWLSALIDEVSPHRVALARSLLIVIPNLLCTIGLLFLPWGITAAIVVMGSTVGQVAVFLLNGDKIRDNIRTRLETSRLEEIKR